MKKLIMTLLLCVPYVLYAQRQYTITVKSDAITATSKAYLKLNGKKDTAEQINGSFTFKGNAGNLELAPLAIDFKGSGRFSNAYYVVNAQGQTLIEIQDPFGKDEYVISGNSAAGEFDLKVKRPVGIANEEIRQAQIDYGKAVNASSSDTAMLKAKVKDKINACFNIPQAFIRQNPGSILCIPAIRMLGKGAKGSPVDVRQLEALLNSLDPKIKNSIAGVEYHTDLQEWKEN